MNQEASLRPRNYFLYTLLFCLVITAVRFVALYQSQIPLWVDEAQYWTWSKFLGTGYYSKPPLIAWIISFTTSLFGHEEFGVRFSAPLFHFVAAMVLFFLGRDMYNEKVGFYSAMIYLTLPGVSISSIFISTDALLMCFWALALFALIHGIKYPSYDSPFVIWVVYALALGLGMLSKYTMVVFAFTSLVYVVMTQKGMKKFRGDFMLASIIAFMLFLPNLIWNYENNFISFQHTKENVVSDGITGNLHFADMFEFIGGQFAVFGPAMVVFIIALIFKDQYLRDDEQRQNRQALLGFSVPLLFAGVLISLIAGAQAHWAAPAYIGLTVLVARYIAFNKKQTWLYIILGINLLLFATTFDLKTVSTAVPTKKNPLERVTMWYKSVDKIAQIKKQMPQAVLVSDERKVVATLMYALKDAKGRHEKVYKWNPEGKTLDHYDLTRTFKDKAGDKDVVFVTRVGNPNALRRYYTYVGQFQAATPENPFYIYLLRDKRE